MYECLACLRVCACACLLPRGLKKPSDPLELEFQMVWAMMWVLGSEHESSRWTTRELNCWTISTAPCILLTLVTVSLNTSSFNSLLDRLRTITPFSESREIAWCLLDRTFLILYILSHPRVSFSDPYLDVFSLDLSAHSILRIFTVGLGTRVGNIPDLHLVLTSWFYDFWPQEPIKKVSGKFYYCR